MKKKIVSFSTDDRVDFSVLVKWCVISWILHRKSPSLIKLIISQKEKLGKKTTSMSEMIIRKKDITYSKGYFRQIIRLKHKKS